MLDKLLSNLAIDPEPFALCMLDNGWRVHLPAPPVPIFHFVLQGHGVICDPDDGRTPVAPLSATIVPVGMPHVLQIDGEIKHELRIDKPPQDPGICHIIAGTGDEHDMIVACGKINARYGDAVGLFDHLHSMLTVDMSEVPNIRSLFEQLLEEQRKSAPGYELVIASLMMQVIVHMFRLLAEESEESLPWLAALQDARLARALDSIFDDPGANHSVESLANKAGMSRSAFAEHFTAAFSRTPINFVNHVRMERAGKMLGKGTASIDRVANQVGFASRSHFSQAFKKHTGQSPAEYRAH